MLHGREDQKKQFVKLSLGALLEQYASIIRRKEKLIQDRDSDINDSIVDSKKLLGFKKEISEVI